jgi:EmrB/QacA subfamily drug resistance transporter
MVRRGNGRNDPAMKTNSTQRTLTILVACLATAMLMLDISVVNTAISDIASSLHASLSGLQWVIDAYTLPLAATVLTAGVLADRGGRRRWFVAGLGLFTAASAVCGIAPNIGTLIAARAVQGTGASILFATALALIAQVTPTPQARATALAAYGATIGAAFAIGPFVGGALTSAFGWRAIFLINVPLGIAAIAIAATRVAESRDPERRGIDLLGQVTLIGGLFWLVFGLLRGNSDGWGSPGIVAALGAGVALLGAFTAIELRGRAAMLPLSLFRDRTFAGVRDLSRLLRRVPLPDPVPAIGARALADRDRPRLPARHRAYVRCVRGHRQPQRPGAARGPRLRRARARRRWAADDAVHDR